MSSDIKSFVYNELRIMYNYFSRKTGKPIFVPTKETLQRISSIIDYWVKTLTTEYRSKGMNALNAHRNALSYTMRFLSFIAIKHAAMVPNVDSILVAALILDELASQGAVSRDTILQLMRTDMSRYITSFLERKSRASLQEEEEDQDLPPLVEWKSVKDFLSQMEAKEKEYAAFEDMPPLEPDPLSRQYPIAQSFKDPYEDMPPLEKPFPDD